MSRANFSSRGSHGVQNGSLMLSTFSSLRAGGEARRALFLGSSELLDVERSLLLRTRAGTGATGGVCGVHKRSEDERVLKAIPFARRSTNSLVRNDWAFPFYSKLACKIRMETSEDSPGVMDPDWQLAS